MTDSAVPAATPIVPTLGPGRSTNVWSIVAPVVAFFIPLAGIMAGAIALGQIKKTGQAGRGLALAGFILGLVVMAIHIGLVIMYFIFISRPGSA